MRTFLNTFEHFLQGLMESSVLRKPIQVFKFTISRLLRRVRTRVWLRPLWTAAFSWSQTFKQDTSCPNFLKCCPMYHHLNQVVPGRQRNLDAVSEEEEEEDMEQEDSDDFIVIDID